MSAAPGSINVPVICGGVAINPGDLIVADTDGVLVIPRNLIARAIEEAETREAQLVANRALIEAGHTLFDVRGGKQPFLELGIEWH